MRKQLILVRHAKSDWDAPASDDFMRPVSARGKHDSPKMGETFQSRLQQLDAVYCSPSIRTQQTAELVFQCLPASKRPPFHLEEDLYLADVETLSQLVLNLSDDLKRIMIIGHNDGLSLIASLLSKEPFMDTIPTSGWVILAFDRSRWSTITPHSGQLITYAYPKQYPWHYR
jgi:phosphohistidine phosphatase